MITEEKKPVFPEVKDYTGIILNPPYGEFRDKAEKWSAPDLARILTMKIVELRHAERARDCHIAEERRLGDLVNEWALNAQNARTRTKQVEAILAEIQTFHKAQAFALSGWSSASVAGRE